MSNKGSAHKSTKPGGCHPVTSKPNTIFKIQNNICTAHTDHCDAFTSPDTPRKHNTSLANFIKDFAKRYNTVMLLGGNKD